MIRPSTIQIHFRSGFSSVFTGSCVAVISGVSVVAGAASAGAGSPPPLRALQREPHRCCGGFFGGHFSDGGFRHVEYGLHILCRQDLRRAGRDDRGRQHVASLEVGQAHGLAIHDDLDAALFELALGELAGRAVLGLHVDGVTDPLHDRAFLDRGHGDRVNHRGRRNLGRALHPGREFVHRHRLAVDREPEVIGHGHLAGARLIFDDESVAIDRNDFELDDLGRLGSRSGLRGSRARDKQGHRKGRQNGPRSSWATFHDPSPDCVVVLDRHRN